SVLYDLFFFSSRRRHTRFSRDWSSDVCSSDLLQGAISYEAGRPREAEKWLNSYIQVETGRRQASGDAFDPTSALADAQMLLARIAEDEGRYDAAYALLGKVTAPEAFYLAQLRQAIVRGKQNRIDEAMKLLDDASPEDEREQVMRELTRGQI